MVEPITITIIVVTALLSGGGGYVYAKATSQKEIKDLQERVRQLQDDLQAKQCLIAELLSERGNLQNRLVYLANKVAELLERDKQRQVNIEELTHRIALNSVWWRQALAMLLFRYRQLLKENGDLRQQILQEKESLILSEQSRSAVVSEIESTEKSLQRLQEEIFGIERIVSQLDQEKSAVESAVVDSVMTG